MKSWRLLVGTLVSAIVGYLAIAFLLGFLRRRYSMTVFVVYRIMLGVGILAAGGTGGSSSSRPPLAAAHFFFLNT